MLFTSKYGTYMIVWILRNITNTMFTTLQERTEEYVITVF